ncbi:MAG: cyclic nucleotide-binding domain-containing protein, partial [Syntrophobacteraceae bacterium]|nr:cyclic nucleotide-binding domain-containing protein [Syntrophobacteraceae bacterium]
MALLDELDQDIVKNIESLAATRSYPKNTIIINQGDESDAFYLVLSGKLLVLILHEDGRQMVFNFPAAERRQRIGQAEDESQRG